MQATIIFKAGLNRQPISTPNFIEEDNVCGIRVRSPRISMTEAINTLLRSEIFSDIEKIGVNHGYHSWDFQPKYFEPYYSATDKCPVK